MRRKTRKREFVSNEELGYEHNTSLFSGIKVSIDSMVDFRGRVAMLETPYPDQH